MQESQSEPTIYCADVVHGGVAVLLCAVDEMVNLILKRTQENPGYKINLELDAYTYEDWQRDPSPALETLRTALRDGRAEIVNGSYTQPMSETIGLESNIRQLQWGKQLAQSTLGAEVTTYLIQEHAFHTALPQILRQLGYEHLVLRTRWPIWGQHQRYPYQIFHWRGADGTTILTIPAYKFMRFGYVPYEIPWLDSWIERNGTARRGDPLEEQDIQHWLEAAAQEGIHKPLATRVPDIILPKILTDETIQKINSDPRLQFTTVGDYARLVEPTAEITFDIPPDDMDTTLPFGILGDIVFIGCKRVENLLLTAEKLSTVAYLLAGRKVAFNGDMNLGGGQNYEEDLRFAWRKLMLAQQHDIWVCGPASTYGYSLADRGLQWLKIAEEITTEAIQEGLVQILDAVAWSGPTEGSLPILVVNPLSWTRTDYVRAELIFAKGERFALTILDAAGNPIPAQIVEEERYVDNSLRRVVVAFMAEAIPGIGYRLYFASHTEMVQPKSDLQTSDYRVSNRLIDMELDETGIKRLVYRPPNSADEALSVIEARATYLSALQGDQGCWIDSRQHPARLALVEAGPVYARYRISGETPIFDYERSITVYSTLARIDIQETITVSDFPYIGHYTGCDERTQAPGGGWHKAGWHTDCFIEDEKLRAVVPINVKAGRINRNVVYIPSETKRDFFSAYDWADISDGEKGLALINAGNARYSVDRSTSTLSLVLGYSGLFIYTTSEEFHRMRGDYHYKYSLFPHGPYNPVHNNQQALEAANPLLALRMNRWPTTRKAKENSHLPTEGAFFTLDAPNGVISTIYLEAGQPVMRLYEHAGESRSVQVRSLWPILSAQSVDLCGRLLETLEPVGNSFRLSLEPYQIVTIKFALAQNFHPHL
ncbi:MAG: hypothetical protein KF893_02185 [Caldilineaceae bacterium]|nr:hypothetical protein [Caldilineaceae bacterium]